MAILLIFRFVYCFICISFIHHLIAVDVPTIDISPLFNGSSTEKYQTAIKIRKACEDVGFFIIIGHGVPKHIIENAWGNTRDFFDLPYKYKVAYEKDQHEYPFGYTSLGGEILSSGKLIEKGLESDHSIIQTADMKEMFSIGPIDPLAGYPTRIFPDNPIAFGESWNDYYETLSRLAEKILESFAISLNLNENFFHQFTDHHASALRALNYPAIDTCQLERQHVSRASAHTDYGAITILRSDGPGLQVSKDVDDPKWHNVPVVETGFIVNLGDLMKRWTNDEWLSTLHRVVDMTEFLGSNDNCIVSQRRQSMAFFYNVNKDALITVLNSENPKYEPIVAGDFLMAKHLASIGAKINT